MQVKEVEKEPVKQPPVEQQNPDNMSMFHFDTYIRLAGLSLPWSVYEYSVCQIYSIFRKLVGIKT